MWRRLHILSPVQSLVLASLSATVIAVPVAARLLARDETSLLRNIPWPDTLNPYITFSIVFMGVVPALLGYYHLGRLGFLLNAAAGAALAWIMAVCGILCFVALGHYSGSLWLSTFTYAACVVLVYMFVAVLHLKAARSSSVYDAQRKLRLFPSRTF